MPFRPHSPRLMALLAMSSLQPVLAQEAEQRLSTVEVRGTAAGSAQPEGVLRRVVEAPELLRMNDSRLAEALRRLPGLSLVAGRPGQPDQITLLGLGPGRTQVLLNGRRVPPGFNLDDIAPEQIARVEIQRGQSAGLSGDAVAGSINLVLRPAAQQRQRRLQASGSGGAAGDNTRLQWQQSGALPVEGFSQVSQGLTLTAQQRDWHQPFDITSAGPADLRQESRRYDGRSRQLQLAPQLSWAGEGGQSVSWNGQLELGRMHRDVDYRVDTLSGTPPAYPQHDERFQQRRQAWRSDLDGRWNLRPGWQLQTGLALQGQRLNSHFTDDGSGLQDLTLGRVREHSEQLTASVSAELGDSHTLTSGLSWSRQARQESREQWLSAAPVSQLALAAGQRREAWFVQDEWDLSETQQLALGWRQERLTLSSESVRQRFTQALPSLQWAWRLPAGQWRSSLSRSFRAPSLMQIQPRPFTSANNEPLDPDTEGNPALRPERAWALDLQFQPRLGRDQRVSVGLFWRDIRDPMLSATAWRVGALGQPRWISSPVNGERAQVRGLDAELQWPLAAAVTLDAQLTRSWSRVRLQPMGDWRLQLADFNPWRAQLGLQGRVAQGQWRLAYAWTSGGWRSSSPGLQQRSQPGARLDLSWQQRLPDAWQLQLGLEGLLQREPLTWELFQVDGGRYLDSTRGQARASLRAGLQRSF